MNVVLWIIDSFGHLACSVFVSILNLISFHIHFIRYLFFLFFGTATRGLERIWCVELVELQESMDRCTGRLGITETLLKAALNTNQSINQSILSIYRPAKLTKIVYSCPDRRTFNLNKNLQTFAEYLRTENVSL